MAKKRKSKKKQGSLSAGEALSGPFTFSIAIATAGLLVAFGLIWWQVIEQPKQVTFNLERDRLLDQYTQLFNGRIAELRAQVGAMAESDAVVEAVVQFGAEQRKDLADLLADQDPYIMRVDLIQKGEAEVDLNAEVPISFAALDLVRRAETKEFVGPEVSLNYRNLIYAAQPVTGDGIVVGVVLVVFNSQFFLNPLSHFESRLGALEVEQRFEGNPSTVVMQWGEPTAEARTASAQLFAPHWSLRFSTTEAALLPADQSRGLLIPFLVSWALVAAAIYLGLARFTRHLRDDSAMLIEFVTRIMRSHPVKVGRYNVSIMREMAETLMPFGKAVPAAESEDKATPAGVDDLLKDLDEEPKKAPKKPAKGDDDDFLEVDDVGAGVQDNFGIEVSEDEGSLGVNFDPAIFRAYDIRGITTENLTEEVVYWIGRAFAAETIAASKNRVVVGWDGRHSSEPLAASLTRGMIESGLDVIQVGRCPTPLLYYATFALDTGTGVMVTGSHNPPEYNGLKMMIAGETLAEERIQKLLERLQQNNLVDADEEGEVEEIDLNDSYIDRALEDVGLAQSLKVVVDCGNGVAGALAPRLLEEAGCEVVPLYCDVDGDFPNHHPDPADPANMEDLVTVVQAENADLGLAFDGDGDRLGVVTNDGEIVWPDRLLMLFAQDIVGRNPGADIIFDVKCSRHLNHLIADLGGRPIMWRTGHSHMKAKVKETGALLAGEFSGHICFGERWYGFDDALYSAIRLLEIISGEGQTATELFAQFPQTEFTPEIKVPVSEADKFEVVERLKIDGEFGEGAMTTIDGLRVDFEDAWGLLRASNTSPVLTLRFEADTPEALERVQVVFREQLAKIDPQLTF